MPGGVQPAQDLGWLHVGWSYRCPDILSISIFTSVIAGPQSMLSGLEGLCSRKPHTHHLPRWVLSCQLPTPWVAGLAPSALLALLVPSPHTCPGPGQGEGVFSGQPRRGEPLPPTMHECLLGEGCSIWGWLPVHCGWAKPCGHGIPGRISLLPGSWQRKAVPHMLGGQLPRSALPGPGGRVLGSKYRALRHKDTAGVRVQCQLRLFSAFRTRGLPVLCSRTLN